MKTKPGSLEFLKFQADSTRKSQVVLPMESVRAIVADLERLAELERWYDAYCGKIQDKNHAEMQGSHPQEASKK